MRSPARDPSDSSSTLSGRPIVLATGRSVLTPQRWAKLDALRAELRGLGAVLVVASSDGAIALGADDDAEPLTGADAAAARDIEGRARSWAIENGSDGHGAALFVLDDRGAVRFAHPLDERGGDQSEIDPHVNDIGAKGLGEIGIVGVGAAIANAVWHATGKRVRELPITLDKLLRTA